MAHIQAAKITRDTMPQKQDGWRELIIQNFTLSTQLLWNGCTYIHIPIHNVHAHAHAHMHTWQAHRQTYKNRNKYFKCISRNP